MVDNGMKWNQFFLQLVQLMFTRKGVILTMLLQEKGNEISPIIFTSFFTFCAMECDHNLRPTSHHMKYVESAL